MDADHHEITVSVNGVRYKRRVESRLLLSDFIRHDVALAGTHVGCEHGVCGACTILLDGQPVRSCLLLAAQCETAQVTTVEGGESDAFVAAAQRALVEENALQCGFCTPGFVLLLAGLLQRMISAVIIRKAFDSRNFMIFGLHCEHQA